MPNPSRANDQGRPCRRRTVPSVGDVRRAYRAAADTYIGLFDGVDNVHPEDVAFIEQHLGSEVGGVLDAGCGPGHLTAHLCDLGVRAMGVDFTPEFIDHARNAHPGAQFRLGSLSDLAEPDGAFAGVLAWYSLIHLPPDAIDPVLAELRRVTATGGILVVGFFTASEVVEFDHKVTPAYYWPVDALSGRLAAVGFAELDRSTRQHDLATGTRAHAAIAAVAC